MSRWRIVLDKIRSAKRDKATFERASDPRNDEAANSRHMVATNEGLIRGELAKPAPVARHREYFVTVATAAVCLLLLSTDACD